MTSLATEFLDHFLSRETPTRYAVMLEGEWGAGKSWFIKAYLDSYAKARKSQDPLWHEGYYYVSLFGKSSRADIAAALFTAAHPGLSSGYAQVLGSTLARVANTLTRGQAVKATDAAALQSAVTQLDGRALIFDDVERCSMSMEDLFGYINDLVEGSRLKVILVANEAELDKKHSTTYRPQKEKVVGKTISARSDPGNVYDALVSATTLPIIKAALAENREAALEIFRISKTNNFRSLQSAIDDFQHLANRADARFAQSEVLRVVFLYLLATTLEHRADRLKKGELQQVEAKRIQRMMWSSKEPSTPDDERLQSLPTRYPSVSWSDPIVPAEIIDQLYTEGTLDVVALNAALLVHPKVVGKTEAPAWRSFVGWRKLGRSDYLVARDRILAALTKGEIVHPGILLHLMATSLTLERNGEHLFPGGAVSYYRQYILDRLKDGTLQPITELLARYRAPDSWDGFTFDDSGSQDFRRLQARLMAAHYLAVDAYLGTLAPKLLNDFKAGSFEAISPFSEVRSEVRLLPALRHLPIVDVADLIIRDDQFNELFVGALAGRYHHFGKQLRKERSWIQALKMELKRRAAATQPPYNAHLSHLIDYWFKELA